MRNRVQSKEGPFPASGLKLFAVSKKLTDKRTKKVMVKHMTLTAQL